MAGYGRLIEERRIAAGMHSRDELAARIGQSAGTVRSLEEELHQLRWVEQVNALVSALPLSAEELLMAMGVNLSVPAAGRIPRQLLEDLAALPPDQLAAIATLARSSVAAANPPRR